MMEVSDRIQAFVQLGKVLKLVAESQPWPGFSSGLSEEEYQRFDALVANEQRYNAWFTEENVRFAMGGLAAMLEEAALKDWAQRYPELEDSPKHARKVAVIMAGNVPAVGFHDLLCVVLSGNTFIGKTSSDDDRLLPAIAGLLTTFAPDLKDAIGFATGKLEGFDAVIATGSNNTSRYFEQYFGKYPNIIRKNRTSVAVLDGSESADELIALGEDVFRFYGLGCRNISKLFVPKGYALPQLLDAWKPYERVIEHHKYNNNYDYNKALLLLNKEEFLDTGFVLLQASNKLASPMATVYYEEYEDASAIDERLKLDAGSLQCVVGHQHIAPGKAQTPQLWDYADGVDTMQFLIGLSYS